MNILILGGRTKFGAHLSQKYLNEGHNVLPVGRQDMDLASGWVTSLKLQLEKQFGDPFDLDVIVVNAYDHRSDHQDVQGRVLESIWNLFKNRNVLIVVMGSLAYHYSRSEYAMAKKSLAAQCLSYSNGFTEARILLIEPGVLENNRKNYPASKWMKFETLSTLIYNVSKNDFRYLQLTVKGGELPSPISTKDNDDNARRNN